MTRCKFFVMCMLAGLAMPGLEANARADFEVKFSYYDSATNKTATITLDQTTGVTTTSGGASAAGAGIFYSAGNITITGLTVSDNGTTGGFRVSATIADSNSPGGPYVATIDTSGLTIKNQTGNAGNSTLTITTGDTGFTAPTSPNATLLSTVSVTAAGTNAGAANSVTFNSYIDTTNAQFGTQQGAPSIVFATIGKGASASDNTSSTVSSAPIPYSLTQAAQITLANGDLFTDMSSGTTLVSPAPHGSVLLLAGLPALGLGVWVRRRRPIRIAI